ncbi:signal transduction histidine kinase [Rhizobium sp. BK060]|nr:signal transduction histidine kinase [Rhizobium sp. BK060]
MQTNSRRVHGGVTRTMLDVSNGRLDSRIPLRDADDDLDHVFKQINDALSRLAGLVEGMCQVSADIAHELKTPLNRLRMTLEEARRVHERRRRTA